MDTQDAGAPPLDPPPERGPVPAPAWLERDGAVARVVLGRAHVRGALDRATRAALRAALEEVAADAGVRCVVLQGSGGSFSAGQDLREHAAALAALAGDPGSAAGTGTAAGTDDHGAVGGAGGAGALDRVVAEEYAPLALLLAGMPKPVVAAVRGTAAGAGAALALACDLRLLALSARLDVGFARVALSPDTGASWWLPRLVGEGRARELLLLPRAVGAPECVRIGLATEAVEDDRLDARVDEVAQQLAAGPTAALAATRRALAFSATHDLPSSLAHEGELVAEVGRRPEHRRAVEAFTRRRA